MLAKRLFAEIKQCSTTTACALMQIVGAGGDGASVISGGDSGCLVRMMYERPHMLAHWCATHRLQLSSEEMMKVPGIAKHVKVRSCFQNGKHTSFAASEF